MEENADISRLLFAFGAALISAGLLVRLGLGRLPGDITVRRENFTLCIPLAAMLIVSPAVSLALMLFRK